MTLLQNTPSDSILKAESDGVNLFYRILNPLYFGACIICALFYLLSLGLFWSVLFALITQSRHAKKSNAPIFTGDLHWQASF
ncbi:MAG: hypothetical protein RSA97_07195 [Oscillospiraceae bacterium]